ncbi:MAG: adenylyl-sulfate kinase [Eubacterium sp.]|nr:adenylyl-sulfate kinase [Eubacterium sp.]
MENVENKKGRLYWITGLSGAGKTTISTLLYNYLRQKQDNIFLIDGDKIREVYQNTDYTEAGREKISYMNMRLCKMLTDQGIDVIIAVIGMRDAYRKWNRENIENYREIYLEVPMEELIRRDSKQIYSRALRKELTNVYGIDMPYEEPKNPDVHIINDSTNTPEEVCQMIVEQLNL